MKLEVFKNAGFEIRGGLMNDEPYFVAMDIAKALDYSDAEAMTRRLEDDEVQNLQIVGFGNRGVNVINESGLYNAILGSKKPEAKQFKKWVTSEVLPTIRKHGVYATNQKIEEMITNPDNIIKIFQALKEERAQKQEALALIEAQRPRIEFANKLQKCEGSLSVQDFAKVICDKGLPMGQNRLFAKLRFYGLIDSRNKPYQEYVDRGYFAVKEGTYKNQTTGDDVVYLQTRITAKGQEYLYKKLTEKESA